MRRGQNTPAIQRPQEWKREDIAAPETENPKGAKAQAFRHGVRPSPEELWLAFKLNCM